MIFIVLNIAILYELYIWYIDTYDFLLMSYVMVLPINHNLTKSTVNYDRSILY